MGLERGFRGEVHVSFKSGVRLCCVVLLPVLASITTRRMTLSCGRNPMSANTFNIKILTTCCGMDEIRWDIIRSDGIRWHKKEADI